MSSLSNDMPPASQRSGKCREIEETLPTELRPIYRQAVDEYEFLTRVLHGSRGYVAYGVLAEMVRGGWRPSAPPISGCLLTK